MTHKRDKLFRTDGSDDKTYLNILKRTLCRQTPARTHARTHAHQRSKKAYDDDDDDKTMGVNERPWAITQEEIELLNGLPAAPRGLRGGDETNDPALILLPPIPPRGVSQQQPQERQPPREEEMKRLETHGNGNGSGNGKDVNYDHPTGEAARAHKQADEDDFNQAVASGLITIHRGPRRRDNMRQEILLTGRSASESFINFIGVIYKKSCHF